MKWMFKCKNWKCGDAAPQGDGWCECHRDIRKGECHEAKANSKDGEVIVWDEREVKTYDGEDRRM